MKTTIQNQINSNVEHAIKATENSYRGKCFLVVRGEHIQSFNKTKRGAEGYIKKKDTSYYDEYYMEMRSCNEGLEVIEIIALDIADYYNTKEIWFESLKNVWSIRRSSDNLLFLAEKLNVNPEVIAFIKLVIENTENTSFPSRSMVGLEVEQVVSEIEIAKVAEEDTQVVVESQEINTDVSEVEITNTITMKLNDEKNGVELYFADKPSDEIRTELKVNGFKWSRFQKCWYAKQNENTIALAEKLTNGNIEVVETIEPFEIELVEFVDITQFKINEETEKRLIDNSLMQTKSLGYETKQLQLTLSDLLENTKEVIEMADNNYSKNTLINGFNAFCERYTRELNSYKYQKSVNPGWHITGRSGLNISRYNKKQDQLNNKMLKVVEMLEKQRSILEKYKRKFKQNEEYKTKQAIEHAINNLDNITLSFSTQKREIDYYGYKYNTRSYESPNYFFMNIAGCYRIFERVTGKEVYSMKTNDKLTDAKKYVMYLESQRVKRAI